MSLGVTHLSLHFIFFLHGDLFSILVEECVLQESELLVGDDFHSESVFELPLAADGDDAFAEVGSYEGMYV